MSTPESFSFEHNGVSFSVEIFCHCQFDMFSEMWELTNTPEAGTTVENPNYHRGQFLYAKPLQYTLEERTRDLMQVGYAGPLEAKAYEDAQLSFIRDCEASDYSFRVSARIGETILLESECVGSSFDYSYHDEEDLEVVGREVFNDTGKEESITLAKNAAKEIFSRLEDLKKFIDLD